LTVPSFDTCLSVVSFSGKLCFIIISYYFPLFGHCRWNDRSELLVGSLDVILTGTRSEGFDVRDYIFYELYSIEIILGSIVLYAL
jgi:hypothetical protein